MCDVMVLMLKQAISQPDIAYKHSMVKPPYIEWRVEARVTTNVVPMLEGIDQYTSYYFNEFYYKGNICSKRNSTENSLQITLTLWQHIQLTDQLLQAS